MPRGMSEALREAFESAPAVQQAKQAEAEDETGKDDIGDDEQLEEAAEQIAGDSGDDGIEIEYANDLPSVLGIEPEAFYKLQLKLDGAEPVELGAIKDRLQQIESERTTLAQERTQLEEQQKAFQAQALQAGQTGQAMTERMQKAMSQIAAIEGAYPSLAADWEKREKTDPGQVALERQRIGEQFSAAQAEYQAAQQEAQQEQQKAYSAWIADQHRILSQKIPEWSVPEKRVALQKDLSQFAMDRYGVGQQELAHIDARMIQVLMDAKRGVDALKNADSAVRKIKASPPAHPKGVRLKNAQHSKQRVQELTETAQKTRTRRDLIAATRGILESAGK